MIPVALEGIAVDCTHESDRTWSASLAFDFAEAVGLPRAECWQVAISVAELVSNATRHAGGGRLMIQIVDDPRRALEVVVCDRGTGIPNVDAAIVDGHSQGRTLGPCDPRFDGLGTGLGAVIRMMNVTRFETSSLGTTVLARKWL